MRRPQRATRVWRNWARTVEARPEAWFEVDDEAALVALVRRAAHQGARLRVVGSGHSWSAIARPEGWLVSLRRLDRVLSIDPTRGRVRVQAGVTLRALSLALARAGMSLSILGSVMAQTVAGATATGTHGSSLRHGNLASAVVGLRLVTGDGEVLELAEDDPRLPGARLGLGAVGIITELELRVEPAFLLEERVTLRPWDEALAAIDQEARAEEYVKYWWLPHTEGVLTCSYRRVAARPTHSRLGRWLDEALVNRFVFDGLLRLGGARPAWVPAINQLIHRAYFRPRRQVGRVDEVMTLAMPPRHLEAEFAIPFSQTAAGLRDVRALIEDARLRVNFIVEARFVPADDAWMSPAYGRDSCHLGVYAGRTADAARYLAAAEAALLARDGRPHWGKTCHLPGPQVLARYPRADRFCALVRALDPQARLANAYLDHLLGD